MRSMYYDRVRTVTARSSSVSLSSLSSEILENVRNHQAVYTESMIRISRELESVSKELSSALALFLCPCMTSARLLLTLVRFALAVESVFKFSMRSYN